MAYGPDQSLMSSLAVGGDYLYIGNYSFGHRVTCAAAGRIVGLRAYRRPASTWTTRTLKLWSDAGSLLGSVTLTGLTTEGWITGTLSTPVPVTAGQTVRPAFDAPTDDYQARIVSPSPMTNGDLSGPAYSHSVTPSGGFPNVESATSNYLVDIIYQKELPGPKTATFVDSFDTQIDTAKWVYRGGTYAWESGQAKITTTYPGMSYIATDGVYDFTESSVYAEVTAPPGATSRETLLSIKNSHLTNDDGVHLFIRGTTRQLVLRRREGSTNFDTSITYDPVAHAWLRVRMVGNLFYGDTSPDGTTWTNRLTSSATALPMTAAQINLASWQYSVEGDTQYAYFDNVNIATTTDVRVGALRVEVANQGVGPLQLGALRVEVANQGVGPLQLGSLSVEVASIDGTEVTAVTAKVWDGSAWVDGPVKVWDGSAWADAIAVKTWNGSAWV